MSITLAIAIKALTACLLLLGSGLVIAFVVLSDQGLGPRRAHIDPGAGHPPMVPEAAVPLDKAA